MLQLKADVVFSNWQQRKNNWQQWFRLYWSKNAPAAAQEQHNRQRRSAATPP
jgi:hypothetical protein